MDSNNDMMNESVEIFKVAEDGVRTMTLSDGSHHSDNDTKIHKDYSFNNQDDHSMEFLKLEDV